MSEVVATPTAIKPRIEAGSGTEVTGGTLVKVLAWINTAESRDLSPASAIANLIVFLPFWSPVAFAVNVNKRLVRNFAELIQSGFALQALIDLGATDQTSQKTI